jgi:hypothetical protein
MLLFCAASLLLASQANRAPDLPVILIWSQAGRSASHDERFDVALAVWKTGRIIWREPQVRVDHWGKSWGARPSRYFEAWIPASKVMDVMESLRDKKVFETNWGFAIPDSGFGAVTLRFFDKQAEWRVVDTPLEKAPYGWKQEVWTAGAEAWKSTVKMSIALIPREGSPRSKPDAFYLRWGRTLGSPASGSL